jgi:transcriptional regulator with XRE-family HTH domain
MEAQGLAQEFLRALRGKRSQQQWSRRIGYRTNVAYMWEAGRSFPTASVALRAAQRAGIDVRAALERFYRVPPEWLAQAPDVASPAAVSALLEDLRAGRKVASLARGMGRSRFAISRFLQGKTEPRLPDFFRLIDAFSLRLLDFVAAFVDPEQLPEARAAWRRLETARRAAYDAPWTQAVLRALELSAYRTLARHRTGWLAERLGITREEEARALTLLADTGQIALRNGRYQPAEVLSVDTRRDPEAAKRLRRFWAEAGLAHAERDPAAVLSFNLGTIAERDLERVHELHRRYFAELRALIAQSEPAEAIVLANVQLVRIG